MALDDATEQVVSIRWAKYSSKCLDVSHESGKGLPGMGLQIWDCAKDPHERELFLLPMPGHFGPIKAVKFPQLCLETHDGFHLSFQLCSAVPQAHMLWTLRLGNLEGYHHIHMAADTARCLDIPNDNSANGNWVQLWQCSEAMKPSGDPITSKGVGYMDSTADFPNVEASDRIGDENFLIERAPVDCLWGQWSAWSKCTQVCGPGSSMRSRAVVRPAAYGGILCDGEGQQEQPCVVGQHCSAELVAPSKSAIPRAILPPAEPDWDIALDLPNWPWWWYLAFFVVFLLCCCLPLALLCARKLRLRLVMKERRKGDDEHKLLGDTPMQEEVARLSIRNEEDIRREDRGRRNVPREPATQTMTVTCRARHELHPPQRPERRWKCNVAAGCKSGASEMGHHRVERLRCEQCDFDLCKRCYEEELRSKVGKAPEARSAGGNGRNQGSRSGTSPQPLRSPSSPPRRPPSTSRRPATIEVLPGQAAAGTGLLPPSGTQPHWTGQEDIQRI